MTHQRLGFLLCAALPGLRCSWLVVCLWVSLPLVVSSASEMHAQSGWDQEIDLAIAEYSTLLLLCFGSLSICTMKRRPINFAAFGWIWADSIQCGKKLFDPLLILYVCPLTKKWSVYNFNGWFIWTLRDRITTKKIQKTHFKKVINWFAF